MSEHWVIKDANQAEAFCAFIKQQQVAGKTLVYQWQDESQRTPKQNNAMWLWLDQLAHELNEAGFDMKKTLKEHVAIPWTKELAKQYLWNPIQTAVTQKPSSTKLTRQEVSEVQEVLARHLAQSKGVSVPFPTYDPVS